MTRRRTVSVASLSVLAFLAVPLSASEEARAEISAAPIQFEAVRSYGESVSSHFPDIGDFNHDGKPDVISSIQNADGNFTTLAGAAIGLGPVDQFPVQDPAKTFRIADFNGDGLDDILQIPYGECSGDTRYHARIFLNVGNGTFREDAAFTNLGLRGRGETALTADFNNDGKLDIFIPFYNRSDDPAKCSAFGSDPSATSNHLLRNDSTPGTLKFTDVTPGSGVTVPLNELDADGQSQVGPAEGAQAADVNGDGLIDFLAGQRLYRNLGSFRFEDDTAAAGLPVPSWKNFEEGAKFIDWNNDGRLDIVSNAQRGAGVVNGNQNLGQIHLYEQASACAPGLAMCFSEVTTGPDGAPIMSTASGGNRVSLTLCDAFGMWGYDINNDGYEDLIVSGTADASLSTCGTSAHTTEQARAGWRVPGRQRRRAVPRTTLFRRACSEPGVRRAASRCLR